MFNRRTMRSFTSLLLSTALTSPFLVGCVTTGEKEISVTPQVASQYLADKPPELRDYFYVSLIQGQRNKVLNDMRLGIASIDAGRYDLAEQLFDDALMNIEAVYADNDQAKKARQLFVKEQTKDFKGEPYERVMAYFYRGLLYMRAGDYENARASFKGGMLQDAFAEEEQYRADFALMPYLQAWAARCSGNSSAAVDDIKEFQSLNKIAPVPTENDNVLVLVEAGFAPQKFSATDPNQSKPRYLKFSRNSGNASVVQVRVSEDGVLNQNIGSIGIAVALDHSVPKIIGVVNGSPAALAGIKVGDVLTQVNFEPVAGLTLEKVVGKIRDTKTSSVNLLLRRAGGELYQAKLNRTGSANAALIENIYNQAVTRGGREFDSVLAGKAQFKSTANTVGNVALVGSAFMANAALQSRNRNDQNNEAAAAGALLIIGLLAKAASDATEPNADTRYWDNLPDRVYGVTLNVPKSVTKVSANFINLNGYNLDSREADIWRAGNCGVAWIRENPARPNNLRAPNSVSPALMYQAVVIPTLPEPTPATEVAASPPAEKPKSPQGVTFDTLKTGFLKMFEPKPAAAAELQKVEPSAGEAFK